MRIEEDLKYDFDDVLIRPKRSTLKSRKDVDLLREFTFKHSGLRWVGLPIIAANMDTVGTFKMNEVLANHMMPTCLHKFYQIDDWMKQENLSSVFTIPSIGANQDDWIKYQKLMQYSGTNRLNIVCIDVANGYGEYFVDFVKLFRETYPNKTIIAGNVVTGEMTEQLILSGADIVKVGIGPGSACTTRLKTGIGYPQLSAVIECADAAHGLGAHVISDGGCKVPGDVSKAFGAGADFVMLGGMLAGHDESGGEITEELTHVGYVKDGNGMAGVSPEYAYKIYKTFYGMSSDTAQNTYYGEQKDYRASEGRTVKVPYRGPVENTIQEILGGLRSTCTYVGAPALKYLSKCTTFIKVNNTHNRVFLENEV